MLLKYLSNLIFYDLINKSVKKGIIIDVVQMINNYLIYNLLRSTHCAKHFQQTKAVYTDCLEIKTNNLRECLCA